MLLLYIYVCVHMHARSRVCLYDMMCRAVAQIYGTAKYKLTFQSCLFFMAPEFRPSTGGKVNEYDGFIIIIIVIYYAGKMRKSMILFYTFRRVSVQVLVQEKIFYDIYILIIPI